MNFRFVKWFESSWKGLCPKRLFYCLKLIALNLFLYLGQLRRQIERNAWTTRSNWMKILKLYIPLLNDSLFGVSLIFCRYWLSLPELFFTWQFNVTNVMNGIIWGSVFVIAVRKGLGWPWDRNFSAGLLLLRPSVKEMAKDILNSFSRHLKEYPLGSWTRLVVYQYRSLQKQSSDRCADEMYYFLLRHSMLYPFASQQCLYNPSYTRWPRHIWPLIES